MTPGVNVIKLFSSLLMKRPNKLECLYLVITFQSSLTFAGSSRSLPKKEASERSFDWVCSGLVLQILRPNWKGFPRANPLTYWSSLSVTNLKSFISLTPGRSPSPCRWVAGDSGRPSGRSCRDFCTSRAGNRSSGSPP